MRNIQLLLLIISFSFAQISIEKLPPSFTKDLVQSIKIIEMPAFDLEAMISFSFHIVDKVHIDQLLKRLGY